jgi:hypothetical protein
VCINQQDDTEKGHQVMLMAQVFSPTTFALGWLSEGNDYTHAAIGAIKDLVSKAWRFGIDALNPRNPDFTPRRSGEGVKQALRDVADQLDYESLGFSFDQAWFSRLWVVQEAALSSELILSDLIR